jgi:hypothetical protein
MQFYTLNQIINLFETIATSHAQINGFNFGEVSDISASEQEQYPLLWIDIIDSSIESNTLSLNMNVKVMDIQKDDQTNERDTLSDCLSISQDVYSALTNPIYQDYFLLSFATNLVPLREALADKVNGWEMNLTFELAQERNRCQIPLK